MDTKYLRLVLEDVGGIKQAARLTGVPVSTLDSWLAGTEPKVTRFSEFCNRLGLSLDEMVNQKLDPRMRSARWWLQQAETMDSMVENLTQAMTTVRALGAVCRTRAGVLYATKDQKPGAPGAQRSSADTGRS